MSSEASATGTVHHGHADAVARSALTSWPSSSSPGGQTWGDASGDPEA